MNIHIKNISGVYSFTLFLVVFFASGCASVPKKASPELKVVSYVDIERYMGKWYEIALYPNWFEKGCFRSTAFYEQLKDGQIKVTNQCRMNGPEGDVKEAIGIATIPNRKTNAKLRVQFFGPLKGTIGLLTWIEIINMPSSVNRIDNTCGY